ncbi:LysE family translocator [Corynebacterium uropygiale]|uniref:LysE family translocator n=1 Tax=Corynebacterium uropygiale TaxID=1775911 RepID=A0A9X1TZQ2_9CORY|nr:LysE family translocator [Corynebacterium uropygiale]MCF4005613.1 LysE family translocator [Corynebacterium uropygiale]
MSLSALLTLIGVWLMALASPGPDVVQIVRVGSRTRQAGIWCALGIMVGNTVWILASLAGLSALISTHQETLSALQLVGGILLLIMGIGAVRGGWAQVRGDGARPVESVGEASSAPPTTPGAMLRLGILTNMSNPKALLFFGAVFAQFITPELGWGARLGMAVLLILIGLAWFVGVALAVRTLAAFLLRHSGALDMGAGVVFLGVAGVLFYEAWQGFGLPRLLSPR